MKVKHFREVAFRVRDPLRPGSWTLDRRLEPSGTHTVSHEGVEYKADSSGWFDVPDDVGGFLSGFPGWRTPDQVDADMAAGLVQPPAEPAKRGPGRPRSAPSGA